MTFSKAGTSLLIATAFVPLALTSIFFYPAVTTKTMLFAALTLIAAALFSIGAARGEHLYWNRLKTKAVWIPLLLLLVAYLSSLLGTDFYHSFWSLFDRGGGLLYGLTLPVVAAYMMLLTFSKKDGETFLKCVSIAATLVSLYALLQWTVNVLNIPIEWLETKNRIGGTLGNAAFLAAYLGMSVWVTVIVHARATTKKWKNAAKASIVLQLLTILVAATRGTMIALAVVLFVLLVWFAIKGAGNIKRNAQYAIIALLFLGALFFGFRSQLAEVPFTPIQRLASISLEDASTANRLFVWGESLKLSGQHFLLGVGAEHIASAFNSIYDPSKITEEWFDRTHNIYIDYLLQYGVLGLVAFLALLFALILGIRRGELSRIERYALFLLTGTYMLQNVVVFDTLSTFSLLLFLFVYVQIREGDTRTMHPAKSLLPLGYAKAVVALVLLVPVVILPAYANILFSTGYKYHVTDVPKANAYFEQGYALGTYADTELGWQLYSMYTERQQHLTDFDARMEAYDEAYSVLSANAEKYPYDARTLTYLAHVIDSRPPGAAYDREAYTTLLSRLIELSPKRTQAWYLTANIYLKEGDATTGQARRTAYEQAVGVLREYIEFVPGVAEPHFIIANLYRVLGETAASNDAFAKGEELYSGRINDARRAVGFLIAQQQYTRAQPYLEDLVKDEPTLENMYDLAKIRYLNGDLDGAIVLVNRVYKESPEHLKTDMAFLAAIVSAYNEGLSNVDLIIEI